MTSPSHEPKRAAGRRHIGRIALSAAVLGLLAFGLHWPERFRFALSYRGTPPQAPRSFTISEQWWPQRRIPFVSERPGFLLRGASEIVEGAQRTLAADPASGEVSGEVRRERLFSLGHYYLRQAALEAESDGSPPKAAWHTFDGAGRREGRAEGGVTRTDYHFLDVAASATTFRVPLFWRAGTSDTRITVDFDPILYTSTVGIPHHDSWNQPSTRCDPNSGVRLSIGVPHTIRYETFVLPSLRPGEIEPRAAGAAEVVLFDGRKAEGLENERPTPEDWARLKAQAIRPDGLRIDHDPRTRTISLVLTAPPAPDTPLGAGRLLLFVATPSAGGRFFGSDCVHVDAETRSLPNPVLGTKLDGLPGRERDRWADQGTNCSAPDAPRLHARPGATLDVRYRTVVSLLPREPDPGLPLPTPRGDADAFLVKVADLANLSERVDDGEWDALRKKAVRPAGVTLAHRPGEKSIALRLPDPAPADLALVVGTRSADHRFFGIDCARIDPTPAPPTLYTVLDGLGGRDRMRWSDEGTLCSDPKSPRLEVEARTPVTVHYQTTVRQSSARPEAGSPPQPWGGDADVFLVKVADLAKLSERVGDDEWDALRSKAVQPEGVKLDYSPDAKAITLWFRDAAPADLALVVGTRSAGRGAFGFDCVRIDPRRASAP